MIEKKFVLFSTKEWLQFLQYKLNPDREKELMDRSLIDPFLKEAVETISDQNNRGAAFQSLCFLISEIEEITGVSESIVSGISPARSSASNNSLKKIAFTFGGLILAILIGFGIYRMVTSPTVPNEEDTISIDTNITLTPAGLDTSASPLDVLPNTGISTVDSQSKTATLPNATNAASKPAITPNSNIATQTISTPKTSTPSTPAENSSNIKANEQFSKAQELYKKGKNEEAKKILENLKSYDNPKREQAEKILKTIGN